MKKVFGQTARNFKREVNKKVLKVPGIEQKVLDATSNEGSGPHAMVLAEIAQASRNYHDFQMIMAVIWKRTSDTGKNWKHVFKALTVLEYLVVNGSERVIDEIRERAYQISILSDFQYIDSSGRDQGSNVRKKSQILVALVNDKDRLYEIRQKAAASREKLHSSAEKYDYDRYEGRNRDEDQNNYGRERDGSTNDGSQHGPRSRSSDVDRASQDDNYSSSRGSGARADDHSQDGRELERKSSEQEIDSPPCYEDAVESQSPVHSERDEENSGVSGPEGSSPPSKAADGFESAASSAHQEVETFDEFDPRCSVSAVPNTAPTVSSPAPFNGAEVDLLGSLSDSFSSNPLEMVPATPVTAEADIFGQSSTFSASQPYENPFGDEPFKAIPSTDTDPTQLESGAGSFMPDGKEIAVVAQPDDNFGFGDSFSAITYSDPSAQPPYSSEFLPQEQYTPDEETDILAGILPPSGPSAAQSPRQATSTSSPRQDANMYSNFHAQTSQQDANMFSNFHAQTSPAQQNADPYASFYSQFGSASPVASNMAEKSPFERPAQFGNNSYFALGGTAAPVSSSYMVSQPQSVGGLSQLNSGNFIPQGSALPTTSHTPAGASGNFQPGSGASSQISHYTSNGAAGHANNGNYFRPNSTNSQTTQTAPTGPSNDVQGSLFTPSGPSISLQSQPAGPSFEGALAIVPQPSKEKFEPKSTVWADTLSRGLVNFNISGPKTNPLADIGIDFAAMNRKEKRMEKPTTAPVTSTITMGKAMGSGTGLGRAGAGAIRPANPMMTPGMGGAAMGMGMGGGPGAAMGMGMGGGPGAMGMGMGGGPGAAMGMGMGGGPGAGMNMGGGYGGMNQQPMGMGMNMGMGGNMNMNMGMGMHMGQGYQMQPQAGATPGFAAPGGYNPMMGQGGYMPQPPYGGGYR